MQRQDKDKRFADLRSFSASFTLKTPIPSDLVSLLTKDEQKQKDLLTKSPPTLSTANASASSSLSTVKPASTNVSPNLPATTLQKAPSIPQAPSAASTAVQKPAPASLSKKASPYALAEIPPFNPARAAAARAAKSGVANGDAKPPTPTASKFNAAAPSFVMRPTAGSFVPGGAATAIPAPASQPPAPASAAVKIQPPVPAKPANPFFGLDSPIDKGRKQLTHVKEEFSPFRLGKCPDAATMCRFCQ